MDRVEVLINRRTWPVPPTVTKIVDAADAILASYPRSGNTWARFLLGALFAGEHSVDFSNVDDLVPDGHRLPPISEDSRPSWRLVKLHEQVLAGVRAIYLVRDPRAVAVSYYYYELRMRRLSHDLPLTAFIDAFIAGATPFGGWGEHVSGWLEAADRSDHILAVSYEALQANTMTTLGLMAAHLGLAPTVADLAAAVAGASPDRMRVLEREVGEDWIDAVGARNDVPFVRQASTTGWEEHLSRYDARRICDAWPHAFARASDLISRWDASPMP